MKKQIRKQILPIIVIIGSICIIAYNVITAEDFGKRFWFRSMSSIFLIIAMAITILTMREQTKNNDK